MCVLYNFHKLLLFACKNNDDILLNAIYLNCEWIIKCEIEQISSIIGKNNSKKVYDYLKDKVKLNLKFITCMSIKHNNDLYTYTLNNKNSNLALIVALKNDNDSLCEQIIEMNKSNAMDDFQNIYYDKIISTFIEKNKLSLCKKFINYHKHKIQIKTFEQYTSCEILEILKQNIYAEDIPLLLLTLIKYNSYKAAKWLYDIVNMTPTLLNHIFIRGMDYMKSNHIVSKKMFFWLKSLNMGSFHIYNKQQFELALSTHNIEDIIYIKCKIKNKNILFSHLCKIGQLNNLKWLVKTYGIDRGNHCVNTININYNYDLPIYNALKFNHLNIVKWLLSIKNNNINKNIAITSCKNVEQLQWISENIPHVNYTRILTSAIDEQNIKIITWLYKNKLELFTNNNVYKIMLFNYDNVLNLQYNNFSKEQKENILLCTSESISVDYITKIIKQFGKQSNMTSIFNDACKKNNYHVIEWFINTYDNVQINIKNNIIVPVIYSIKITNNENNCIVCMEDTYYITNCNHYCCKSCMSKWMKINNNCPYCRNELIGYIE